MNKGQAALTLIFFALVAMIITSAAVMAIVNNNLTQSKMEQSLKAYTAAETGTENALLKLLRQPDYQGETFNIDQNTTVTVTLEPIESTSQIIIISQGQVGQINRQIKTIIDYNDNVLQIVSTDEIQ